MDRLSPPVTPGSGAHAASPRPSRPATAASLHSFTSAENGSPFSGYHGPDRQLQHAVPPASPAHAGDQDQFPTLQSLRRVVDANPGDHTHSVVDLLLPHVVVTRADRLERADTRRQFLATALQTAERMLASALQNSETDLQAGPSSTSLDRAYRAARLLGQAADPTAALAPQRAISAVLPEVFRHAHRSFLDLLANPQRLLVIGDQTEFGVAATTRQDDAPIGIYPLYFDQTQLEAAVTLLHENHHRAWGGSDHAYGEIVMPFDEQRRYATLDEMTNARDRVVSELRGHENPVAFTDFQRDLRNHLVQRDFLRALTASYVPPRERRQENVPVSELLESRSDARLMLTLGNPDTFAALVQLYADLNVVPQSEAEAGTIGFNQLRRQARQARTGRPLPVNQGSRDAFRSSVLTQFQQAFARESFIDRGNGVGDDELSPWSPAAGAGSRASESPVPPPRLYRGAAGDVAGWVTEHEALADRFSPAPGFSLQERERPNFGPGQASESSAHEWLSALGAMLTMDPGRRDNVLLMDMQAARANPDRGSPLRYLLGMAMQRGARGRSELVAPAHLYLVMSRDLAHRHPGYAAWLAHELFGTNSEPRTPGYTLYGALLARYGSAGADTSGLAQLARIATGILSEHRVHLDGPLTGRMHADPDPELPEPVRWVEVVQAMRAHAGGRTGRGSPEPSPERALAPVWHSAMARLGGLTQPQQLPAETAASAHRFDAERVAYGAALPASAGPAVVPSIDSNPEGMDFGEAMADFLQQAGVAELAQWGLGAMELQNVLDGTNDVAGLLDLRAAPRGQVSGASAAVAALSEAMGSVSVSGSPMSLSRAESTAAMSDGTTGADSSAQQPAGLPEDLGRPMLRGDHATRIEGMSRIISASPADRQRMLERTAPGRSLEELPGLLIADARRGLLENTRERPTFEYSSALSSYISAVVAEHPTLGVDTTLQLLTRRPVNERGQRGISVANAAACLAQNSLSHRSRLPQVAAQMGGLLRHIDPAGSWRTEREPAVDDLLGVDNAARSTEERLVRVEQQMRDSGIALVANSSQQLLDQASDALVDVIDRANARDEAAFAAWQERRRQKEAMARHLSSNPTPSRSSSRKASKWDDFLALMSERGATSERERSSKKAASKRAHHERTLRSEIAHNDAYREQRRNETRAHAIAAKTQHSRLTFAAPVPGSSREIRAEGAARALAQRPSYRPLVAGDQPRAERVAPADVVRAGPQVATASEMVTDAQALTVAPAVVPVDMQLVQQVCTNTDGTQSTFTTVVAVPREAATGTEAGPSQEQAMAAVHADGAGRAQHGRVHTMADLRPASGCSTGQAGGLGMQGAGVGAGPAHIDFATVELTPSREALRLAHGNNRQTAPAAVSLTEASQRELRVVQDVVPMINTLLEGGSLPPPPAVPGFGGQGRSVDGTRVVAPPASIRIPLVAPYTPVDEGIATTLQPYIPALASHLMSPPVVPQPFSGYGRSANGRWEAGASVTPGGNQNRQQAEARTGQIVGNAIPQVTAQFEATHSSSVSNPRAMAMWADGVLQNIDQEAASQAAHAGMSFPGGGRRLGGGT